MSADERRLKQVDEILAITAEFFRSCTLRHGRTFLRRELDQFLDERLELMAKKRGIRK